MNLRSVGAAAAMAATLLTAALLTVGAPDWARARDFLTGRPTSEGSLAVAGLICWAVVVAVSLPLLAGCTRRLSTSSRLRQGRSRAAIFLAGGAVVLALGVLNRASPTFSICCGDSPQRIEEASRLAH